MLCLDCLSKDTKDICNKCQSSNILNKRNGKYIFKGQAYTSKEWFKLLTNFIYFEKNKLKLRKFNYNINVVYLKKIFIKNIIINSILRLFLPCTVFLFLSLLNLLISYKVDNKQIFASVNETSNVIIFLRFIFLIYISFFFIYLKRIIFKEKIYVTEARKITIYKRITNQKYMELIGIYDQNIPNC